MHYNLRSHILRCPTDTRSHRVSQVFGETEVHNLDVAPAVQEQVLRLEVPVDDVEGVEVSQSGDDLGCVELRSLTASKARLRSDVLINLQNSYSAGMGFVTEILSTKQCVNC